MEDVLSGHSNLQLEILRSTSNESLNIEYKLTDLMTILEMTIIIIIIIIVTIIFKVLNGYF